MIHPHHKTLDSILADAETSISKYQSALDHYSEAQFKQQPHPDSWSIGQVFTHLDDAWFGFMKLKLNKCLGSEEYANESLAAAGVSLFEQNKFPAIRIKGAPKSSYDPQPAENRDAAKAKMEKMRLSMREIKVSLAKASASGKRRHFVFGYMNAWEWFELSAIHLRHHWGQKERIDAVLDQS